MRPQTAPAAKATGTAGESPTNRPRSTPTQPPAIAGAPTRSSNHHRTRHPQ